MTADRDHNALQAFGADHHSAASAPDSNRNYKLLFEHSPVAGLLVNREGLIIEFNRRAADLLLIDPELRSCPDLPGYVSHEEQTVLASHINATFDTLEQHSLDIRIQIAEGQEVPVRLVFAPIEDEPTLCMVTLVETGPQNRNVKVLSHLAYYDQLSGLPNRLLFNDRLRWAIRDARRRKEKLAVMVIDLDNFKNVNDTLGHDAGDQLLKCVSDRMLGCLRDSDTLSRMGGDEFTILMQHVADTHAAEIAAGRLLEVIRQPCDIMDRQVAVSGSIGICFYPDDGDVAENLIHNADIAMYRSKASGRNRIAFFNEAMRAAVNRQNEFEHQLRDAMRAGQLTLFYQPLVDGLHNRIIGVEALLRWRSKDNLLPAAKFFKTAETLGLCGQFSDWALQQACIQMKQWLDRGLLNGCKDFRLTVNICSEQLCEVTLPEKIQSVLLSTGLPASALAIDLAEDSVRFEDPRIVENLKRLREMGIALQLDDFAQGFASLQKACTIPFDSLKIDRIMTTVFLETPGGEALLEALVNLSHILGLKVIAEGVESESASQWLKMHACDGMQGYYFCRPLPAVQMEMLLSVKHESA